MVSSLVPWTAGRLLSLACARVCEGAFVRSLVAHVSVKFASLYVTMPFCAPFPIAHPQLLLQIVPLLLLLVQVLHMVTEFYLLLLRTGLCSPTPTHNSLLQVRCECLPIRLRLYPQLLLQIIFLLLLLVQVLHMAHSTVPRCRRRCAMQQIRP